MVKVAQYYEVNTPKNQVEQAVENHQVNIGQRIFPGMQMLMPVIAQ